MTQAEQIAEFKRRLRETDIPYFSDEEIITMLTRHAGDLDAATYEGCLLKAHNSTLQISGLSLPDTSKYFLRLAAAYRPINTGTL